MKCILNKYLIAGLFVISLLNTVAAQDDGPLLPIKVMVRSSFGGTIPLTPLKGMGITDNLIGYDKNAFYLQFLSGAFYFSDNFGVELAISHNTGGSYDKIDNNFNRALDERYASQYFVDYDNYYYYSFNEPGGGVGFHRFMVGGSYKVEKKRLVFIGRMLVGFTTLTTSYRYVQLKEKNSNEIIDLIYNTDNGANNSFTVNPSFTLGYRVSRRIMLTADVGYMGYRINPTYRETSVSQSSGETNVQIHYYDTYVQELTLGVGASVILWQKE